MALLFWGIYEEMYIFFKKAIIICSFVIGPNVKMLWCMARNVSLFNQKTAGAVISCRLGFLKDKKQKHGICPVRQIVQIVQILQIVGWECVMSSMLRVVIL